MYTDSTTRAYFSKPAFNFKTLADTLQSEINPAKMGTGGGKHPMREINDTRAATARQQFENILERVKTAGGTITRDEEYPLYIDVGIEQDEIGSERTVEFNLNGTDFQLIRKTETHRLQGAGRQKSLEELKPERVTLKLKKKPELDDNWVAVDLEDVI